MWYCVVNNSPAPSIQRFVVQYVKPHWPWLLLAVFFMVIEGGSIALVVYLLQPLFDEVFLAPESGLLYWLATALVGIMLLRAGAGYIQRVMVMRIGLTIVGQIQQDAVRHLLRLDLHYFSVNSPGHLIERVRGDAQALQSMASNLLISLGRDSVSFVALVLVAMIMDWRWTLLAFLGVPLIMLPLVAMQRLILKKSRQARQQSAKLTAALDEIFHGIKSIKLFSLAGKEQDEFSGKMTEFIASQTKAEQGKAAMPAMIDLVAGLGLAMVIIVGGLQIQGGDKSLGQFMSFFAAMLAIFDPLRRLSNLGGAVAMAKASIERLYQIFDQPIARVNTGTKRLDPKAADLVLQQLDFAYDEQLVLQQLSLTAKAGQVTALVGASGSGKSTVFNLLTNLYAPQSGRVLIGGIDLAELDASWWLDQMAVVSQESALFDLSIAENIALGRADVSPEQLQQAAQTALVTDFAQLLPQGMQTAVGPRGSNLSGGQRQRVVIARALLRDAPILLMDEATSALDSKTEQELQQRLLEKSKGKTTLIIAHRLSTILHADCIHLLHNGRVISSGTHQQLVVSCPHYQQLYHQWQDQS